MLMGIYCLHRKTVLIAPKKLKCLDCGMIAEYDSIKGKWKIC